MAIALVPSPALVVVGAGAAGALVDRSAEARTWADELQAGITPTREIIEAVQAERRISLWHTVGAAPDIRELTAARLRLDNALRLLAPAQSRLASIGPSEMGDATAAFSALGERLTGIRAGIDAGTLPLGDAYAFYSRMPELVAAGTEIAQQTAPDAATATELADASEVLQGLESMSRATALGAALATDTGLTAELSDEFIRRVGYYRTRIERLLVTTDTDQMAAVQALITGAAWQRLGAMEAALAQRALADLWQSQSAHAQRLASDAAAETTRNSLWAGAGMLVIALGAILVALALANRIIRRLKRLRDQTFALAESRTREGVKAVFLDIAHRSQVVVHKQLELLDEAESRQEDPALLDIFFRLDHLATRERRNAENLVILAGGRPGRQWRNPVPLMELVRSAVGETIDYTRVRTGRLPETFVAGTAVGDLIHLLAELMDNATAFSPPQSQVSISGHTVGRGVALEISDQGMGIPGSELARLNTLLATPADFGVTTLSEDSRLGLFVVSLLAERNGIAVKLAESDYGGIRAIVLIPAGLIAGAQAGPDYDSEQLALRRRIDSRTAEYTPPTAALPRADTGQVQQLAPPVARSQPDAAPHTPGGDSRPALPRRARQANLATELAHEPGPAGTEAPPAPGQRTAEQARDLMSAIEIGTRQGRQADPDGTPPNHYRQEGDGDQFTRR